MLREAVGDAKAEAGDDRIDRGAGINDDEFAQDEKKDDGQEGFLGSEAYSSRLR